MTIDWPSTNSQNPFSIDRFSNQRKTPVLASIFSRINENLNPTSPTKLKPKPSFSPMFLSNFQSNQICALASYLQANVCLAIWSVTFHFLLSKTFLLICNFDLVHLMGVMWNFCYFMVRMYVRNINFMVPQFYTNINRICFMIISYLFFVLPMY
jgi:hypothetical protein